MPRRNPWWTVLLVVSLLRLTSARTTDRRGVWGSTVSSVRATNSRRRSKNEKRRPQGRRRPQGKHRAVKQESLWVEDHGRRKHKKSRRQRRPSSYTTTERLQEHDKDDEDDRDEYEDFDEEVYCRQDYEALFAQKRHTKASRSRQETIDPKNRHDSSSSSESSYLIVDSFHKELRYIVEDYVADLQDTVQGFRKRHHEDPPPPSTINISSVEYHEVHHADEIPILTHNPAMLSQDRMNDDTTTNRAASPKHATKLQPQTSHRSESIVDTCGETRSAPATSSTYRKYFASNDEMAIRVFFAAHRVFRLLLIRQEIRRRRRRHEGRPISTQAEQPTQPASAERPLPQRSGPRRHESVIPVWTNFP